MNPTPHKIPRGVMSAVAARASCTYYYAWKVLSGRQKTETLVTARIREAYRQIMAENFPQQPTPAQ